MTMTDPLSDMLARIRNGQLAQLQTITSPHSALRENVLKVLQQEGYITGYSVGKDARGHKELAIELKYVDGKAAITEINKVSKPGRRVYSHISKLQKFFNGLGVVILSTSQGVISDYEARQKNLGGEVLCVVF